MENFFFAVLSPISLFSFLQEICGVAPRSNLKQCIRLLTSRLESTSEFITLNLVMKDEVLRMRHLLSIFVPMLPFKPSPILLFPRALKHNRTYVQTRTGTRTVSQTIVFGKRRNTIDHWIQLAVSVGMY